MRGWHRERERGGTPRANLLAAALTAGFLFCRPAFAEVAVVAPPDGALLGTELVKVAGMSDGSTVAITVNGTPVSSVPVSGGYFSASITLRTGKNRVSFQSPTARTEVRYEFPGAAAEGTYRFHEPYVEESCSGCHGDGTTVIMSRNSALCHSCHDSMDEARFLHGPVGAGQCTICHDPHGSVNDALLTVAGSDLCVTCHNQPGSSEHMKKSRNRNCGECHDPHGSEKKFFIR